jgi:hypothetical protein
MEVLDDRRARTANGLPPAAPAADRASRCAPRAPCRRAAWDHEFVHVDRGVMDDVARAAPPESESTGW